MTREQSGSRSRWTIDRACSAIRFALPLGDLARVEGSVEGFSGLLVWDETTGQPLTVEVEIDAHSLVIAQSERDLHLHTGDFLDVETYPIIRFVSRRVEVVRADRLRVVGLLQLHGVVRPIVLLATVEAVAPRPDGCDALRFSGSVELNLHDFELRWGRSLAGLRVGDRVRIDLDVIATCASGGRGANTSAPAALSPAH